MTLKDIILETDFNEMWNYLVGEYGDHDNEDSRVAYFNLFKKLQSIAPVKSEAKIRISYSDENGWWDVSGVIKDESYAIEFITWNEWLGKEIEAETLSKYKVNEIAAYCLWEMIYVSFDEDIIQSKLSQLNKTVDEIKEKLK